MASEKTNKPKPEKKAPKEAAEVSPWDKIYVLQPDNPDAPQAATVQGFKAVRVHRSRLKNAPYNPRTISEKAKGKLKENLRRVGLVETIVWNFRTGNIVGGHQRLGICDSIMESPDYWLDVAMNDFDDMTEREQNIFLNNPEVQGDWDMEKLGKLFKEDKIGIERSGFDTGVIYQMFGDSPLVQSQSSEQLTAIADRIRASWGQYEELSQKTAQARDPDFYLVVIFEDSSKRVEFTDALGLPDNCYVDGRLLLSMIGNKQAHDIS
jgi:hypothetical protein